MRGVLGLAFILLLGCSSDGGHHHVMLSTPCNVCPGDDCDQKQDDNSDGDDRTPCSMPTATPAPKPTPCPGIPIFVPPPDVNCPKPPVI